LKYIVFTVRFETDENSAFDALESDARIVNVGIRY